MEVLLFPVQSRRLGLSTAAIDAGLAGLAPALASIASMLAEVANGANRRGP